MRELVINTCIKQLHYYKLLRRLFGVPSQITQQSEAMSDQAKQLEAARHASTQEGAAADARVRALQQGGQAQQQQLNAVRFLR
jgi:hypothetical protein